MNFKVTHNKTTHHFFLGIPECFIGNWLDESREVWNNSVESMIASIAGVQETCLYGEYSIFVAQQSNETFEECQQRVQKAVDGWTPPFEYKGIE